MLNSKAKSDDDRLASQIFKSLEHSQERESVTLTELFDNLCLTYGDSYFKHAKVDVVDSSYNGLKLGEHFEESDFKAMFHDFKHKRKIHAKYVSKVIEKALKLIQNLPNIQEITLKPNEECIIVGDLHGHFDDLASILARFNIPGKLYYFVFNGDWVDRGECQIEVVLTLLYSFILFPTRVILNRGNHEDHSQNSHAGYRPCLKSMCDKYFDNYGSIIYKCLNELFISLPLAAIVNNPEQHQRIFVVHGGVHDQIILDEVQKIDRKKFATICRSNANYNETEAKHLSIVQDLLWSDPYPSDDDEKSKNKSDFNHTRNIGKRFGSNITRRFLQNHNLTMLVRSHECKSDGYKIMHNGKLITVFSASNYNNQSNQGSVLRVSSLKFKLDVLTYKTSKTSYVTKTEDALTSAIKELRTYLYGIKTELKKDFKKYDTQSNGTVTIKQLISVLNEHLPDIPYAEIKDRICECDDNADRAKYETIFSFIKVESKYENIPDCITSNHDLLKTIFQKMDKDLSGYISPKEFKEACRCLNIELTRKEISSFMKAMDKNNDGSIDLQEFNNAFTVTFTK